MTKPLMPTERRHFIEQPPWNQRWTWFALGAVFAILDFVTGPFIQFPIFFVLPVMLMAWTTGLRWASILAITLSLVRFSFHFWWQAPWTAGIAVINAILHGGVLLVLATVTAKLANYGRALRERVQTLEGILPICAFCKDIRNETGHWQQVESYVSHHSEAQFSHGVCPKCAEKHYGEFLHK
jgi:hypothetical protein